MRNLTWLAVVLFAMTISAAPVWAEAAPKDEHASKERIGQDQYRATSSV